MLGNLAPIMILSLNTCTYVKLGKLLTEEVMYAAVGHIGVWVRALEQADDEGEVGHLIISIIIICMMRIIIIIICIIMMMMAMTWSTVGTRSQKRSTSQHWEARLPSPDIAYLDLGTVIYSI